MSVFDTIPLKPTIKNPASSEVGAMQHFRELRAGAGPDRFEVNPEGVFIGGLTFDESPWNVTYAGVQTLGNGAIVLDGPAGEIRVGGGTVIDEIGLNSQQNFQTGSLFGLGPFTEDSTSYQNVPGAVLDPFVLDRSTRVLVFVNFQGTMEDPMDFIEDNYVGFCAVRDEVGIRAGCVFSGSAATYTDDGITYNYALLAVRYSDISVLTMSAGTHTLRVQLKVSGGECEVDELNFGYLVLGL